MKRALALTLILALLGSIGMTAAALSVGSQEDQVVITEEALYGDPAAAYGLNVRQRIEYDNRLRWETNYTPGEEPVAETEFTFSPTDFEYPSDYEFGGVNLYVSPDVNSMDWTELELGNITVGIAQAYYDLFQKTEPGTERSELIRLADYFDYYPLSVSIDHLNLAADWDWTLSHYNTDSEAKASRQAFLDYFRIPVLEEETLEISVRANDDGRIGGMGYHSTDSDDYQMGSVSTVTDDACYFALNNKSYQGKIMDFSLVPGGYGIYRLPASGGPNRDTDFSDYDTVIEPVSTIYPLDPEVDVKDMMVSSDQTKLLLLTSGEKCALTVIDLATMETLQKLTLTEGEAITSGYLRLTEDFLLVELDSDKLALLLPQKDGTYRLEFVVSSAVISDYADYANGIYGLEEANLAWDGEKLAVGQTVTQYRRDDDVYCVFTLAVYDRSGLLYYGLYTNSLGLSVFHYEYRCWPASEVPLTISWTS